jgi:predicted  nucleic acid-binding Zn-ribbon protein
MASANEQATCPKCGSTSIQAVPVERRKIGDAIVAEYFLGTAAGVAAGSSTVIQAVCLKCGCQWFPGTVQEQRLRAAAGELGEAAKRAEEQRQSDEVDKRQKAQRNLSIGVVVVILLIILIVAIVSLAQNAATNAAWKALDRQRDSVRAVQDSIRMATTAKGRHRTGRTGRQ